jgi:hypothetical protein
LLTRAKPRELRDPDRLGVCLGDEPPHHANARDRPVRLDSDGDDHSALDAETAWVANEGLKRVERRQELSGDLDMGRMRYVLGLASLRQRLARKSENHGGEQGECSTQNS